MPPALTSRVVRALGPAAGLKACTLGSYSRPLPDDIINNTVFLTLVGRHDVVPLCIILDALHRLAGVMDQDVVDPLPHSQDFAGRNINIGRLPGEATHQWLVD